MKIDLKKLRGRASEVTLENEDGSTQTILIRPLPFNLFMAYSEKYDKKILKEDGTPDDDATRKQNTEGMLDMISETLHRSYIDMDREEIKRDILEMSISHVQTLIEEIFSVNGLDNEKNKKTNRMIELNKKLNPN